MKIQLNTDSIVDGNADRIAEVNAAITKPLDRFKDQITRIEVHLSADKQGEMAEHQCALEARIEKRPPVTVTHKAPTTDLALKGAVEKMKTALTRTNGKSKPF